MDLEQLLALLGCANVAEAATLIARMNTFLADGRAVTGKSGSGEVLDAMRAQANFAKSVEAALGCTGPAALGRIEALKTSGDRVTELEAQSKASLKAAHDRDAKELIDQATASGKIKPAARANAEGFYAKHGIEGLRSFVDSLPEGGAPIQSELRQSAPGAQGSTTLTPEEREIAKAMGKTDEQMLAARKTWDTTKGTNFAA